MVSLPRVVLVVPPFAGVEAPSLGVSILAAQCKKNGIECTVLYENLQLAKAIGLDSYTHFSLSPSVSMMGEGVFACIAYPKDLEEVKPDELLHGLSVGYCMPGADSLTETSGLWGEISSSDIDRAISTAPKFIDEAVSRILFLKPDVVGFSSVFQQTNASVAIARRIKERCPSIITVLGGANAVTPMGEEIARVSKVFDYVFSGEADMEFPDFIKNLPAFTHECPVVIECAPVNNLDEIARPDYSDYMNALRDVARDDEAFSALPKWIFFESSRGCWWGQKNHCTFCGLNANGMNHREKKADKVKDELLSITSVTGMTRVQATDNILPLSYFRTLLPDLAEEADPKWNMFYEVKSNLKEAELDLFVRSGVHSIQPGIESLSTNILKLMRKGVTGAQNIALLRNCNSRGIYVCWSIIMGFPGESEEDYKETVSIVPYIEHLQPPTGWGFVRFDRFSPYHFEAEKHGIRGLRPIPTYSKVFPKDSNLDDLAYYFIGDYYSPLLKKGSIRQNVETALMGWKKCWSKDVRPRLDLVDLPNSAGSIVIDTRSVSLCEVSAVNEDQRRVLDSLKKPMRRGALSLDEEKIMDYLIDRGWIISFDGFVLSIVAEPGIRSMLRRRHGAGLSAG